MPFLTTLGSTDLAQPGENEHSSAQRYTSIVLPIAIFLQTRSQSLRSIVFGPILGARGPILGPFWASLGLLWGPVGAVWGHFKLKFKDT